MIGIFLSGAKLNIYNSCNAQSQGARSPRNLLGPPHHTPLKTSMKVNLYFVFSFSVSDSESVNTVRDIHIEKRRENVVPRSKAKIHQSKGIPKSVEGIDDERKPPVDSSLKQRPMKSFSSDGTAVTPARQFPLKTVEQTIGPSTPHEANKNVEPHSTKSTDSEVIAALYRSLICDTIM